MAVATSASCLITAKNLKPLNAKVALKATMTMVMKKRLNNYKELWQTELIA